MSKSEHEICEVFTPPRESLTLKLLNLLDRHGTPISRGDLSKLRDEHEDLIHLTDFFSGISASPRPDHSLHTRTLFLKELHNRSAGVLSVLNFRDMAGMPTQSGGATKSGVLFRSANPYSWAAPECFEKMCALGITLDIDLRMEGEVRRYEDAFGRVVGEYRHLPLFTDAMRATLEPPGSTLRERYANFLGACREKVVACARLVNENSGGTLIHCKVGKDRTGITIGILLDAVGVTREALEYDYAISAPLLRPYYDAVRSETDLVQSGASMGSTLRMTLEQLDECYGGSINYLRGGGLSERELERLADKLTENAR